MQAWIVKHVRVDYMYANGGSDGFGAFSVPSVFWTERGADDAKAYMQVPEDWKVVEVEITEKE